MTELRLTCLGLLLGSLAIGCELRAPDREDITGGSQTSTGGSGGANAQCGLLANACTRSLSVGRDHACVATAAGTVRCWGSNPEGAIGLPPSSDEDTHEVADLAGIVAVSAGYERSCARSESGSVWCWGTPPNGTADPDASHIPVEPTFLSGPIHDAIDVSAGHYTPCVVRDRPSDNVECWGTPFESTPVPVGDLEDARSVATSRTTECALTSSGKAYCWADDPEGSFKNRLAEAFPAFDGARALSAGVSTDESNVCALLGDGSVACRTGQSGTTSIAGIAGAISFDFDRAHGCFVKSDCSVWCWGDNEFGQVDPGAIGGTLPPTQVAGVEQVAAVSVGDSHSCAQKRDGSVECWGVNGLGQLGNPLVPGVQAPGEFGPIEVAGICP